MEKLYAILDVLPDGVHILNEQCDIQYVNPALKNEFGTPKKG